MTVASHGDDNFLREAGNEQARVDAATRRAVENGAPAGAAIDEMGSTWQHLPDQKRDQLVERLEQCALYAIHSVPVEHGGITYGTLTVVRATQPSDFELELLDEFATTIAFNYQQHRQQTILVRDTVTELDVRIDIGHFLVELCQVADILAETTIVVGHLCCRGSTGGQLEWNHRCGSGSRILSGYQP